MKKRVLSFVVTICMILGIIVIPVRADITEGYFTYQVTPSKDAILIGVDKSISGDVVIPSTTNDGYWVKGIGERAFNSCNGITSLTLGDVAEIDPTAFMLSSNIESITVLPGNNYYSSLDGVLFNIDKTAIISCPPGKSGDYIIPNGVTEIGEWAFYSCENLLSVTIPEGVTSIACESFSYCTGLEEIKIPDGVEVIDCMAFAGCFELSSITLPGSVTVIGDCAFDECESISEVHYGSTMEDWSYIEINDGNEFLENAKIYCTDGVIEVEPASGETHPEDKCGKSASWNFRNGILTIEGTGELYKCSRQDYPWYKHRNDIETVIVYDGIENVPERAFDEEYDSLTTVYIAPSVTQIDDHAFYNDEKLKDIYFYGDAPNVGGKSISYNESLVLHCINTADGWTDSAAYDSATNKWHGHMLAGWADEESDIYADPLDVQILKNGVLTVYSATGSCYGIVREGINKVVLSNTVKSIREMAFAGYKFDFELSLPKTLESIGGYAFARCNSVSLELDSDNPYIKLVDGVLYSADMTELIYASPKLTGDFVTPSTVEIVHDGAFVFSRFDSITISDSVTTMTTEDEDGLSQGRVFANAQCKHIVIGKNVEELGIACFFCCPVLEDVTFLGMDTIFYDDDANRVVMRSGEGETAFGGDVGTGHPAKLYFYENSYIARCVQNYEGEWEFLDSGSAGSERPTAPKTAPVTLEKGTTYITIGWTAGSDDVEVKGYNIYVNGKKAGSTTGSEVLSYTVSDLRHSEKYEIAVKAVDGDGQESDMSPILSASTVSIWMEIPDLEESYITDEYPYGIKVNSTVMSDEVLYAPKLSNASIKYRLAGSQEWNTQELSISYANIYGVLDVFAYPQDTTPVSYIQFPEGEYEICFEVEDTSGAVVTSPVKSVTLKYDDIAPTKPGNAVNTKCNTVSIILDWNESYDNIAVDHYVIYRDGKEIGASESNSFTDTNLKINTEYQYIVCAVDKRGNISDPSDASTLKTADIKISDYTQFAEEYMMELQTDYQIPFDVTVQTDVDMSPVYVYMNYTFEGATEGVQIDTTGKSSGSYNGKWTVKENEEYLSEGNYSVKFTATDGFTSVMSDMQTVKLIRDNIAPVINSVASPQNGLTYGGKNIPILYDITDNVGVFRVETDYTQDGTNYSTIFAKDYAEFKNVTDSFDWNAGGLISGNYKLRVSAFDKMNNRSESISDFDIDNTPPAPVSDVQIVGNYRNISVNWSHQEPEDGMTYKIYRATAENGEFEEINKQSECKYKDDLTTVLPDTVYYYKITALDKYENESEPSEILSAEITSDTEKPVAVISPDILFTAKNVPFLFSAVNSTDNDEIASYSWDFGDGTHADTVTAEHTYNTAGKYTVTLSVTDVSGNTEVTGREITVEDPYANKDKYTLVTLNIVDAATSDLTPISGASLQISYENGDSTTAMSDESGKVKIFMPIGSHTVGVTAPGYMPVSKNLKVRATSDGTMNETMGISKTELIRGELTSKEMTYDEILDAGIDPTSLDNNHVWKFSATFEFHVGIEVFRFIKDLWIEIGPGDHDPHTQRIILPGGWFGDGDGFGGGNHPGGGGSTRFGIFPTEKEGYYLVIYGEAHWLKEMYNVELLVMNDSYLDTVENCVAELELPEGLSLATMLDRQQTPEIEIGHIDSHSEGKAQWFVRGDEEGEYNISAKVTGELVSGSVSENFIYRFRTNEPVKVYAGSALKMTITADDVARKGDPYHVTFRIENVSDKSLYKFGFGITGIEQFKLVSTTKGGHLISEDKVVYQDVELEDRLIKEIDELAPGGFYEIEITTTCLFKHELDFIGNALPRLKSSGILAEVIDIAYYLDSVSVATLEGSTTSVPCEFVISSTEKNEDDEEITARVKKEILKEEPNLVIVLSYYDGVENNDPQGMEEGVIQQGDGWAMRWKCTYYIDETGQKYDPSLEIYMDGTDNQDGEKLLAPLDSNDISPWLTATGFKIQDFVKVSVKGTETNPLIIIGDTFKGYTNIRSVELSHIRTVSSGAFEGCRKLGKVEGLDGSLISIGDGAFKDDVILEYVDGEPVNLKTIGTDAFRNTKIKSFDLGSSITELKNGTFAGCIRLKTVYIPNSLRTVKEGAFAGCDALEDVYYDGIRLQWNEISVEANNEALANARVHFNDKKIVFSEPNDSDSRHFEFKNGEEIEDLVFSTTSTEYNPRLAHFMSVMARAAYHENLIKDNYTILDMDEDVKQEHYDSEDGIVGYTIAKKGLQNGAELVMITIRGSSGTLFLSEEWKSNYNTDLDENNRHIGFMKSVNSIYEDLKEYLGGTINISTATYLITGHSQGGAVGNLLSIKLDEDGVPNSKIYDYNFACPNVAYGSSYSDIWNGHGQHSNMFNILNNADPVTVVPAAYDTPKRWKRYGRDAWFNGAVAGHDMANYVDFMKLELTIPEFPQNQVDWIALSIECPVDVYVYDSNGELIASVENDTADYHGFNIGEKALIFAYDGKKQIYVDGSKQYDVKLMATGEGTMKYTVVKNTAGSDEVAGIKVYEAVELNSGKEMQSSVGGETQVDDVKLYVVDEEGNATFEIKEDGTEAQVYTVEFDANGHGTAPGSQTVALGEKAVEPATPTEPGYTFGGWYKESGCVNAWRFESDTVSADITLYAKWTKTPSGGGGGGGGGGAGGSAAPGGSDTSGGSDLSDSSDSSGNSGSSGITGSSGNQETDIENTDNPFKDVKETDWFYDAVRFVYRKGIADGVSDDSFAPNDMVTRGQFITMLCRAYGIPEMEGDNFADCGNTWYTGYLAAAKQLGISSGIGDNMFAPERKITREEMVTLIYNHLKSEEDIDEESTSTDFADNDLISDWAIAGVAFANERGYVNGKDNNIFDPKGNATRAELAQIFYNIFND